jgi:antirestriction protein ArdC
VTERLIAALDAGVLPWRRPWSGGRLAQANLVSGRRYTNWFSLMMLNLGTFESPFWLTSRQARKLGGEIVEGAEATPVVSIWWREVPVNNRRGMFKRVPKWRYSMVFNYDQCRGLKKNPRPPVTGTFTHEPLALAESLASAMPDPPAIEFDARPGDFFEGWNRACYDPGLDLVRIPRPEFFERRADYYSALFHELAHSTAHKRRLNRALSGRPGDREHGLEELIAEMAAAFLCGQAGIFEETIDNSAAYLKAWLKSLRGDHRLVVSAAVQAQKAADYILGRIPGRAPAAG